MTTMTPPVPIGPADTEVELQFRGGPLDDTSMPVEDHVQLVLPAPAGAYVLRGAINGGFFYDWVPADA